MRYVEDDGGRAEAGFKAKHANDCVTRSIAIATEQPYKEVYDELNRLAKKERPRNGKTRSSSRNGVHRTTFHRYMLALGWFWVPTMQIGSGCQVHLTDDELPMGNLVVRVSKHVTAVKDGVIHDTHDPQRDGTRCVYGFYHGPA
jgi:hypothetical protein